MKNFTQSCALSKPQLHNQAIESNTANDLKASIDAWDKVAQYTEPKLKAMEIDVTADVVIDHPNEIRCGGSV